MTKIYIDESGDLGLKGSKYFILTALIIDNDYLINRIIKNMRRNKFKKQLSKAVELKASNSSTEIINYLLIKLNEINFNSILIIILKEKNYSNYLINNHHKLYNYLTGKLALNLNVKNINELEIYVDKSKRKNSLRKDFDEYFIRNLKSTGFNEKITISHSYSHKFDGLQIVDFIAYACFQKFEHNNNNYIDNIKSKVELIQIWK
ncbi:MAG: DUF3800 domain-containing protein [Candidatus ainarchaeum sp.]|nr:DUF3800 domain-containing protein [Candidatus ainarchaeum sp.]